MPKTVVFPGTFDPFTFGHADVVCRAEALFGSVVVAVAGSETRKTPLIPRDSRVHLIEEVFRDHAGVRVMALDGLLVRWMTEQGFSTIIRGLRNGGDFDDEWQQVGINRTLCPDIETVWLPAASGHSVLASRFVREIASLGGDVGGMVPSPIADWLARR